MRDFILLQQKASGDVLIATARLVSVGDNPGGSGAVVAMDDGRTFETVQTAAQVKVELAGRRSRSRPTS